jgi:hypothetical protein
MRFLTAVLVFSCVCTLSAQEIPLQNWSVPSTPTRGGGVQSNTDNTNGTIFIGVEPCRVVDTRGANGAFGGPAFASLETRTYDLSAGPCTGLPSTMTAVSLNFTVVSYDVSIGGFVTAFRSNSVRPGVSTVNFGTGPPVANAAVVASAGGISVYTYGTTHLIIDINGYFMGAATTLNSGKYLRVNGTLGDGGIVQGNNLTTTSGSFTSGVFGTLGAPATLTDGAGVMGYTTAGTTWGVKGFGASTAANSGGVLGIANARTGGAIAFNTAGVRGESQPWFGVLGITAGAAGVGGVFIGPAGTILRSGYLANDTYAVYAAGDIGASGTKFFVDPHPTDASKVVRFAALEGPEAGTYFRGRGKFVSGRATIEVPEAFRLTAEEDGLTVHLTPIGGLAMVAVTRQSLDHIEAEASRDVEFSYVVYGVRRGYRDFEPIRAGTEFVPDDPGARLPAYLNEDQKRRLIENGTYNEDGTVNLGTAVRLGWDKGWEKKARER